MDMGDQNGRRIRPVGLSFKPTQQELIFLLQVKAQAADVSAFTDFVLEKNLYGKDMEPWKVFSDVESDKWEFYNDRGTNDAKRVAYVITKLSKMSAKKTVRTAGCGTWDGQTRGKPVENYAGNKTIGYMKLLTYVLDPGCESEAADQRYWYMQEYSLSEDSLREIGVGSTDYVLCRIIRDDTKSCGVKSCKSKNVKGNGGSDQ